MRTIVRRFILAVYPPVMNRDTQRPLQRARPKLRVRERERERGGVKAASRCACNTVVSFPLSSQRGQRTESQVKRRGVLFARGARRFVVNQVGQIRRTFGHDDTPIAISDRFLFSVFLPFFCFFLRV